MSIESFHEPTEKETTKKCTNFPKAQKVLEYTNKIHEKEGMHNIMDNAISGTLLSEEEKESVINMIISEFGNDKDNINSIITNITKLERYPAIYLDDVLLLIENKKEINKILLKEKVTQVEEKVTQVEEKVTQVEKGVKREKGEATQVEEIKLEEKNEHLDILKKVLKNTSNKEILDLLEQEKIIDIINLLKTDKSAISGIVKDLGGKNSYEYEEFKKSILELSGNDKQLEDAFTRAERSYEMKSSFGVKEITSPIKIDGKEASIITEDKFKITIGEGGSRDLRFKNSDYKIESRLENKKEELEKIDIDLKGELNSINNKIKNKTGIIEYINKVQNSDIDFMEMKNVLKKENLELYNLLRLENKNSKEDLNSSKNELNKDIEDLEEQKIGLIKEATEKRKGITMKNTKLAEKQDEKKKDILKFFHSIGFDLIDQNLTTKIIDFINSKRSDINNNGNLPKLIGDINLEEGKLGFGYESDNNSIHQQEMINFMKLFNKMISGDINNPNTINEISVSITDFKASEITTIRDTGELTTDNMIKNLQKK